MRHAMYVFLSWGRYDVFLLYHCKNTRLSQVQITHLSQMSITRLRHPLGATALAPLYFFFPHDLDLWLDLLNRPIGADAKDLVSIERRPKRDIYKCMEFKRKLL